MKLFKTIDYYAQLFLIVAAFAVNLFLWGVNDFNIDILLLSYFIVGGWQVCSLITHFLFPAAYKVKLRVIYQVLFVITLVAGIVTLPTGTVLIFGAVMLFWSPVLAILYAVACYREMKLTEQPTA